ncbi:hypothetical protein [Pseudomonas sp. 37 R 15]|nr:hypothetical protein [Pseudomonas sp. 37 R 15]CRM64961.1 hypothetical protein [Pseudomonas sp. 37 R 15]
MGHFEEFDILGILPPIIFSIVNSSLNESWLIY